MLCRTAQVLVVTALTLLVTACGPPTLMPTPVAFAGTGADPLAETPADVQTTAAKVFVFTDRKPSTKAEPTPTTHYSNERDYGLRIGAATVELGEAMTWDELHTESLRAKREAKPRIAVTAYEEYGALFSHVPSIEGVKAEDPAVVDRFVADVRTTLAASEKKDVFVFVHGFNTKFAGNTEIAAQLHHYLGRQGVFVSYEWPSRGSMFKYAADKQSAAYSTRYFRLLLTRLATATGAERINIIAHSAGAPVAVGAIRELCLMHFDEDTAAVQERYKIGHLVLVAPDMDLGQFINAIHDEITGVPEVMTIYISTRDKALSISRWINGFARLGSPETMLTMQAISFLEDHPMVEMVDVGNAERDHGSWLGHSYFHEDPWVSSDVIMALRFSAIPSDRGLVRPDDSPIWQFPKDYPNRAAEAARKLYGAVAPSAE